MNGVTQILKYIKCTIRKSLIYKDQGYTQIVGYSDADWTG